MHRLHIIVLLFLFLLTTNVYSQNTLPDSLRQIDPKKIITSFYSELSNSKNKPAPEIAMSSLDNDTTLLISAFQGKVLLLKFWAINCGPCRAELPKVNRLYDTYTKQGLVVLYLSSDAVELQKKFYSQYNAKGMKARILTEKLAKPYDSPLIPRSILIDRQGLIRDGWVGILSQQEMERKIAGILLE